MSLAYDPDLFDAQLLVERYGRAYFDRHALAQFFGIQPQSVWRSVWEGRLPKPARYDEETQENGGGQQRVAIWTADQVAAVVVQRRIIENQDVKK